MTNETLEETISTCLDHIDEIEDWYGEEDLRNNIVDTVMEVLATHFSVSRLDLNVGAISIKSDNNPYSTEVLINGKPIAVKKIDWKSDANEPFDRLRLTFM